MKSIIFALLFVPSLCSAASRVVMLDPDSGKTAPIDSEVAAQVVITEEHHQAHQGKQYRAYATFRDLAANATGYVLIQTTTTYDAHIHISYNVGGNFMLYFSSGAVASSTTSIRTPNLNQEDYEGVSSNTKFYKVNTLTSAGTYIADETFIEGGSGRQSAGSSGSGAIEWILNSGKAYLLGMENLGSQAKTATMIIQYYEVAK